jgi:hypothetical protein
MEINALLAAIAALRVGGPDVARAKAESAARAAAEGDLGLSATDIVRIAEITQRSSSSLKIFGRARSKSKCNNFWEKMLHGKKVPPLES